jgi:hypothetical protein
MCSCLSLYFHSYNYYYRGWYVIFFYINSLQLIIYFCIGGIGLCAYYYSKLFYSSKIKSHNRIKDADSSTTSWKICGIALGAATCIIGVILIILTRWKQTHDRPWRYETKDVIVSTESYTKTIDPRKIDNLNDDELHDYLDKLKDEKEEEPTRETASSPIPNPFYSPLKTFHDDLIFCPGCNRLHLPTHQCMYSTRLPNSYSTPLPSKASTDENFKNKSHAAIDRSMKISTTNETQTAKPTSPKPNVTESVILRRVPIPTTKVVVQQPTTKVMIVRVPNVPGELVIQPKATSTDEK